MAAAAVVEDGHWLGRLQDACSRRCFAQARPCFTAFAYIGALLAGRGNRRSCWQLAGQAGHATPRRMQALLAGHSRDWKAALAGRQRFGRACSCAIAVTSISNRASRPLSFTCAALRRLDKKSQRT